jgi:hypothetical protein
MELLAHASAPSSRKDDERFKRQAKAYLNFEPANMNSTAFLDMSISQAERPLHLESPVYLDNTQEAYTALDSQLLTSSQISDEYSDEDGDDDTVLPLPLDSSLQPLHVSGQQPPDESSLLARASPRFVNIQSPSFGPSSKPNAQGHYIPTPSRPLQIEEYTTPSYMDGLSTIEITQTPSRHTSMLRAPRPALQDDNHSSLSDNIPSQLPSTYSISLNSDPIYSDQNEAQSSLWGSLPRGSAPQPWTGQIEDESPLKGVKSLGKRPVKRLPPFKQPLRSPRADMSAQARSLSAQEEISSVSLDRAVAPLVKQQPAPPRQDFTSSFELRFSSAPQARGTQSFDETEEAATTENDVSVREGMQSSFESRFSSTPQAQGTQSTDASGAASLAKTHLRRQVFQPVLPTSFESRFSSSPEAQGTPFAGDDRFRRGSTEISSSPSSKINLFQPKSALKSTGGRDISHSAVGSTAPSALYGQEGDTSVTKSSLLYPTSSISEPGVSGYEERSQSEPALHTYTPLNGLRTSNINTKDQDATMTAKKRKFASLSTPKTKANTQEQEVLKSLSTMIHPPYPATSSNTFITHITPQLQSQYWDSAELAGKYRPAYVRRGLRTSERGYWEFDTRSWSARIQIKFWVFLESNIGGGVSGWGVWCLREEGGEKSGTDVDDVDDDDDGEDDGAAEKEIELGIVRVFCWGEVVGHVWLLCYVASQAKLKHVESRWVDADGKVVVRI